MKKISQLTPNPQNPRLISKSALNGLRESLKKFGDLSGVVFNKTTGQLVGGHQRVKIFSEIDPKIIMTSETDGWFEYEGHKFPYREVEWSESKEAQANLTANNPEIQGAWDLEKLPEIVATAQTEEGFDSLQLGSIADIANPPDTDLNADEVPEVDPPAKPVTAQGDVYEITVDNTTHRLMCGDSTSQASVDILMDGKKADLLHTDPPYMVDYHSKEGNSYSKGKYKGETIFNDNLTHEDALEFYDKVAACAYAATKQNAAFFWWLATSKYPLNESALRKNGWLVNQMIIWVKESFVFSMGQMFHRAYEPCLVGWKKGKRPYTNPKLTNLQDVFSLKYDEVARTMDVWFERRDAVQTYVHPTQKPVNIPARAIVRCSKRGERVLDLFGGSGSTLLACIQLGRIGYLMELDPKYCDAIIGRVILYAQSKNSDISITKNGQPVNVEEYESENQ